MIDVDKLTDAELRTKLLEFGFPVMPITGTTRKVMAKKLKILLESNNKVGSSDGRRSLGRYSSEEESDSEVKATKNQKNRRVTMAAPILSSSIKTKKVVEPEVVSSSPQRQTIRSSTSTTTRSAKILKAAQDDFDTGSDSESDVVASTSNHKSSNKYDTSFNRSFNNYGTSSKYDVANEEEEEETGKGSSPVRSTLSTSYSRYSPGQSSDLSYSTTRNVSFGATSSPARHSVYGGEPPALSGSLASDYAADRLSQIRNRLSFGSPVSYTSDIQSPPKLTEADTPFLSNFTRRLSALSASKKSDLDNKNDLVKEHDVNGASPYARSYLSNFKATRGRDFGYDLKTTKRGEGQKNVVVSYMLLLIVALFFVILAIMYFYLTSSTSLVAPDYAVPPCSSGDPSTGKHGSVCVPPDLAEDAVNLLNSIKPELYKRSRTHRCDDRTVAPQMTEAEIVAYCESNYAIDNVQMVKRDLRNLELLTFANPQWGVGVVRTERSDRAARDTDVIGSREQLVFNHTDMITGLLILNPEVSYLCALKGYLAITGEKLLTFAICFSACLAIYAAFRFYRTYTIKRRNEVNAMVEDILDMLQLAAAKESENTFLVINHVRDAILNVKERKAKQKIWDEAVKYINENESRVRTEVRTVHGESFDVWKWISTANLSTSNGDRPNFTYRPGRRIVDVKYMIEQLERFPHSAIFFCRPGDVEIKSEVREGFFSIYILRCGRCLKEHALCSEKPKSDLLDVNLAVVAGIVSLGLDLYQLNELCSAMRVPPIPGDHFNRYLREIREIYNDSKQGVEEEEEDDDPEPLLLSVNEDDDASKSSDRLNATVEEIGHALEASSSASFAERKEAFLRELRRDLGALELRTVAQSDSELWHSERKKRLTASNFGRIVKLRADTDRAKVARDLLRPTFKGNAYTEYGRRCERAAVECFEAAAGKRVTQCGLVVHKDHPFLAASPDGVVVGEDALVEIKCPYKARDCASVRDAFERVSFATLDRNGDMTLKREDRYYYQVQGQLHVTGKRFCYFVVWMPSGLVYEVVERDEEWWERMFPKLKAFYFDHMLPEILKNL